MSRHPGMTLMNATIFSMASRWSGENDSSERKYAHRSIKCSAVAWILVFVVWEKFHGRRCLVAEFIRESMAARSLITTSLISFSISKRATRSFSVIIRLKRRNMVFLAKSISWMLVNRQCSKSDLGEAILPELNNLWTSSVGPHHWKSQLCDAPCSWHSKSVKRSNANWGVWQLACFEKPGA